MPYNHKLTLAILDHFSRGFSSVVQRITMSDAAPSPSAAMISPNLVRGTT